MAAVAMSATQQATTPTASCAAAEKVSVGSSPLDSSPPVLPTASGCSSVAAGHCGAEQAAAEATTVTLSTAPVPMLLPFDLSSNRTRDAPASAGSAIAVDLHENDGDAMVAATTGLPPPLSTDTTSGGTFGNTSVPLSVVFVHHVLSPFSQKSTHSTTSPDEMSNGSVTITEP